MFWAEVADKIINIDASPFNVIDLFHTGADVTIALLTLLAVETVVAVKQDMETSLDVTIAFTERADSLGTGKGGCSQQGYGNLGLI